MCRTTQDRLRIHLQNKKKKVNSFTCHPYGFSTLSTFHFWLVGGLLKLVQFRLSRVGPSAARQHGWVRMYVCDSCVHLYPDREKTVVGSFMKTEQHLFFFYCLNTAAGLYWSVPVFLDVYNTNSIMRGLEECTTQKKKNLLCLCFCPPHPPTPISQRASVFSCRRGSSCSEHLVVAFGEHSGRREESDRAMVGTLEMSAPEAGRQGGVEWQAC